MYFVNCNGTVYLASVIIIIIVKTNIRNRFKIRSFSKAAPFSDTNNPIPRSVDTNTLYFNIMRKHQ